MRKAMIKQRTSSLLKLIASMLIYGTIGLFRRSTPVGSELLASCRGIIGALFLLSLLLLRHRRLSLSSLKSQMFPLVLSGAMIGINWLLLFEAYNYTSVAIATLCYYMQPVIVLLLSVPLFHERMTLKRVLCMFLAALGMFFVSGVIDSGLPSRGEIVGILLGLGAALLYAGVIMVNKTIHGVPTEERTLIQLFTAGLVLLPHLLATGGFSLDPSPMTILLLLLMGIVHTGIAYALYFDSMDGLPASVIALFSYIDPVTAILLSALLLGESLTPLSVFGTILILGSTLIYELLDIKDSGR